MNKTYNIEQNLSEWLINNAEQIFIDILESCELYITTNKDTFSILKIKTINGITEFTIKGKSSAISALWKCEKFFVGCEKYELAARARDCGRLWDSI